MKLSPLVLAAAFVPTLACNHQDLPRPTPVVSPAPGPTRPSSNGSFTWTSIVAERPICRELTSQVGGTWRIWFTMQLDGASVTLGMAETPPPYGPLDEGPAIYKGTREGDAISASRIAPFGGMACPGDNGGTPQISGELTAQIVDGVISGDITETYGSGPNQVIFIYRFTAVVGQLPILTLSGRVTDAASSQPISGATIEWVGGAEAWGDRGDGVVTNASGLYQLVIQSISGPSETSGIIWLRASKDGYASRVERVNFKENPVAVLNFPLVAAPSPGASR